MKLRVIGLALILLFSTNIVVAKPLHCNPHNCPSPTPTPSLTPTATPTSTVTPTVTPTVQPVSNFVIRTGTNLSLNNSLYKFTGFNIYNANSRNNCWYSLGANNTELDQMLTDSPGTTVFRAWFYEGLAGTPTARDWAAFDHTLAAAARHNMKVIVSLSGEWGDCQDYPQGFRKTRSWFQTGYTQNEASGVSYRNWVKEIVTRYSGNTSIFSFELLSEPEAPEAQDGSCTESLAAPAMRSWLTDMVSVVRGIDNNHLISVGTIGSGQCGTQGADYQSFFAVPGVDLCDYHDYGSPSTAISGDQWNGLALRFTQCNTAGKAFIISEAGITGAEVNGDLQLRATDFNIKINAWDSNGVDGYTLWNLCRIHDPAYGQCDSNSYDIIAPNDPIITKPVYIFDDEFNGSTLGSVWSHHYNCCGTVLMDPSLSTVSGGYLHQAVVNRSGTWFADILDTKTTWTKTYGYFEARMKIAKGKGFWPAFWLYNDAVNSGDEIDTMEVCSNPLGGNGGNDSSLLHMTVHKGTQATQLGNTLRTVDLSLAFHVYAVDWRPTYIAFYLDGVEVWRETSMLINTSKALLVNFGVGGSWCSAPDSTTPSGSEQLIDWIRVSP